MALLKTIDTNFGVTAGYWHIYALEANRMQGGGTVHVAGYLSEVTRRAGRQPLATVSLGFDKENFPGTSLGVVYSDLYDAIKRQASTAAEGSPFRIFLNTTDA